MVVQFFEEHDPVTVQGAIRASCLACFDGAQADDMKATLASAEIALATLMGVLDELAATGNLGRQDVVDGYAQLFHELILAKLEAAAAETVIVFASASIEAILACELGSRPVENVHGCVQSPAYAWHCDLA